MQHAAKGTAVFGQSSHGKALTIHVWEIVISYFYAVLCIIQQTKFRSCKVNEKR